MRHHTQASLSPLLAGLFLVLGIGLSGRLDAADARSTAADILQRAGMHGGLLVHLGCGDGKLTAELGREKSYLVLGLDTDPAQVAAARARLVKQGVYGRITVDVWDGKTLPLADNLATVIVGSIPPALTAECQRVLEPLGVMLARSPKGWTKTTKPWPGDIDEWTHYLHAADNNAVARDTRIGPPTSLQWVGSPRWSRHHDRLSSTSALVSAGRRIFTIFDEGPTASILLPSRWFVIARDAFNGTVLWKHPIPEWQTRFWPLKSGPAQLPRRLVATRDEVYVTLGIDVPLSALDAATGTLLRTYEGTRSTVEILYSKGTLFLLVNPKLDREKYTNWRRVGKPWWEKQPVTIMAVDAASGRRLWQASSPVAPLTLGVDAQRVYFHDGEKIVALDRRNGKVLWASAPVPMVKRVMSFFAPTLVVAKDVVLFAGGEESGLVKSTGGATKNDTIHGIDAATGKILWSAPHPPSGYSSPEDVFVLGDTVWFAGVSNGNLPGVVIGRDVRTGVVRKQYDAADVETYWFHHRCYRGKATSKYLMVSRTGIEFIDPTTGHWDINHWIRGSCMYGIMPANGLIYTPPNDCACYPETKISGFGAAGTGPPPPDVAPDKRLVRGPAYAWRQSLASAPPAAEDWPTYRADMRRRGATRVPLSSPLTEAWKTRLPAPLSAPTIAGGRIFVTSIDAHTVHALRATDGTALWHYTAGGRIDSPPTVDNQTVIFGSADGWITCLRADTGELVWRFLAAPAESRIVSFEQLESRWPVHGAVLVVGGVVNAIAGRSLFLDGGMRFCRLDARTGKLLSMEVLDRRAPKTGEDIQAYTQRLTLPVALPDVLSSDGAHIYMRSQVFDMLGKRQEFVHHDQRLGRYAAIQDGPTKHLFASAGFLDGTWFHRAYWLVGRSFEGGWNSYYLAGKHVPAGKILSVTDQAVFGFGRKPRYFRWTTPMEFQLFAAPNDPKTIEKDQQNESGSLIRVNKSASLNPTGTPVTVMAWVKTEKPGGVILAQGGGLMGYSLYLRQGKVGFAVCNKSKRRTVVGKTRLPSGWVHVTGCLTANAELRVYVNGRLDGKNTDKNAALLKSNPIDALQVGGDEKSQVGPYRNGLPFKGLIDDVRIYHGAMTDQAIKAAAEGNPPQNIKAANLVLHFTFDDGKTKDASGKKNHGQSIGITPAPGKIGQAMRFTGVMPGAPADTAVKYAWTRESPILVRAMLVADDRLVVAGPEDVVDEPTAFGNIASEEVRAALTAQFEGLEGKHGGKILVLACKDGKQQAEISLDTIPVWDGFAAARGCLYMAGMDGTVRCFRAP